MLADGTYDVLVVDAQDRDDGRIGCDLTVLSGAHKGEMVSVVAPLGGDAVDLLALPGTLEVSGGEPHLTLEP